MDVQKRKKAYSSGYGGGHQKKRKEFTLEPGIKGFFCTCNFRERDCVRDAYKLLNEFADNLYGVGKVSREDSKSAAGDADVETRSINWREEEEDISTALSKEVAELKAESTKPAAARKFQVVDTGVKNVVFIRTTVPDPLELVTAIVEDLERSKKQRTRFLLRLLPIEVVCRAFMDDIKSKADVLLEKYFAQEPKTFSIVFNRHSNNKLQRSEVIEELAAIISKKNPGNKADLKNPELAVVVEVIRGLCLISVAPNYFKLKKYNLLEICGVKEDAKDDEAKDESKETNDEDNGTVVDKATHAEGDLEEAKVPDKVDEADAD